MKQHLPRIRKLLLRGALVAGLVVLALTLALVLGGGISSSRQADCIVVPGAAVRPGRVPSDALRYRLEGALELYRAGRAPMLIVTGGGEGDYAEAEVMAEWLIRNGMPMDAILLETEAANTRESGVFVARIMREHGLSSALVCSQWFHVARTRLCLAQEGVLTYAAPCGGNVLVREPMFIAREMVALPIYAARLDELR